MASYEKYSDNIVFYPEFVGVIFWDFLWDWKIFRAGSCFWYSNSQDQNNII